MGLVLSLAVFLLLSMSSGPARQTSVPVVRVPDTTPFVVRGTRFQPNERVRVVARVDRRHVKTVVATAKGVFRARFPGVSVRDCAGYVVRATGSKGSTAFLRQLPSCAEP